MKNVKTIPEQHEEWHANYCKVSEMERRQQDVCCRILRMYWKKRTWEWCLC